MAKSEEEKAREAQQEANRRVFRVKRDVSVPLITHAVHYADGSLGFETEGVNLPAGSHLTIGRISQPLRHQIETGQKEDFFEEVDEIPEDANVDPRFRVFAPEHETEAQYLRAAGHKVLTKDELIAANSADADSAKAYLEEVHESEEPRPTSAEEESSGVEIPAGTEKPPGIPIKQPQSSKRSRPGSKKSEQESE